MGLYDLMDIYYASNSTMHTPDSWLPEEPFLTRYDGQDCVAFVWQTRDKDGTEVRKASLMPLGKVHVIDLEGEKLKETYPELDGKFAFEAPEDPDRFADECERYEAKLDEILPDLEKNGKILPEEARELRRLAAAVFQPEFLRAVLELMEKVPALQAAEEKKHTGAEEQRLDGDTPEEGRVDEHAPEVNRPEGSTSKERRQEEQDGELILQDLS